MRLFGRHIEVLIEDTSGNRKTFVSQPSEDKYFSMDFTQDFGKSSSLTTINLYNVNPDTAKMCESDSKKRKYAKAEISAGYGDDLYLLNEGTIIQSHYKQKNADRVLTFKIAYKSQNLNDVYITENYENTPVSFILRQLFSRNGIKYFELNFDDTDKIVPSFSFSGPLKKAIRQLAKMVDCNYHWSSEGKCIIDPLDPKKFKKSLKQKTVVLNRKSGLIGVPERNGKVLKGKSLLNPSILKNSILDIQFFDITTGEMSGDTKFRVLKGKYVGSSFANNFYTEFEAVKA